MTSNPQTNDLRNVLNEAKKYIEGVNADWPKGQDDDRDELVEKIERVMSPNTPDEQPDDKPKP